MSIHYKNRHLPSSLWSEGNHLSPPHRRDFKDCKQILEDSLTPPLHIKARSRLQPASCQKTCPDGQSGIRRLPACIRCAPASSQSSSIHNSLRSVNPATASCSLQKPTGLFAYRSRGLETFAFLLRQILRTPRFFLRRKSLHLLSKFSSQYLAIPSVIPYIYTINQNYLRETFTKHHNRAEDSGLNRSPILQCSRMAILDIICLLQHQ